MIHDTTLFLRHNVNCFYFFLGIALSDLKIQKYIDLPAPGGLVKGDI